MTGINVEKSDQPNAEYSFVDARYHTYFYWNCERSGVS